ncbi:hypothetical protein P153DRAFT_386710 [Dothidotthia symphoricarpi CBS 119687]|uniref:Uncharacterized protein n=1 Tax=Dothidotthia symphoricarpi CBS 119687 TaxID=1392245 RepID=A0A6A6AC58_9PLEO|nr:uncharacterized protein P153DRAFT_386710 [Dothidotthia symphoricarpi CBS 119687]KAF2128594.1 hypothetical protein P153DRAFT_386710 [Dothidotthia symphoricarpi CBS 119687]
MGLDIFFDLLAAPKKERYPDYERKERRAIRAVKQLNAGTRKGYNEKFPLGRSARATLVGAVGQQMFMCDDHGNRISIIYQGKVDGRDHWELDERHLTPYTRLMREDPNRHNRRVDQTARFGSMDGEFPGGMGNGLPGGMGVGTPVFGNAYSQQMQILSAANFRSQQANPPSLHFPQDSSQFRYPSRSDSSEGYMNGPQFEGSNASSLSALPSFIPIGRFGEEDDPEANLHQLAEMSRMNMGGRRDN